MTRWKFREFPDYGPKTCLNCSHHGEFPKSPCENCRGRYENRSLRIKDAPFNWEWDRAKGVMEPGDTIVKKGKKVLE